MVAKDQNIDVRYRKDDRALVISTTAHVSHKKGAGPWSSTFSLSIEDATKLRDKLNYMLFETGNG